RVANSGEKIGDRIGHHDGSSLPGCLDEPRNLALEREAPQTDAAHPEAAKEPARPSAEWASIVTAHAKLGFPDRFHQMRRSSHRSSSIMPTPRGRGRREP